MRKQRAVNPAHPDALDSKGNRYCYDLEFNLLAPVVPSKGFSDHHGKGWSPSPTILSGLQYGGQTAPDGKAEVRISPTGCGFANSDYCSSSGW